jgi:hypothetical protein
VLTAISQLPVPIRFLLATSCDPERQVRSSNFLGQLALSWARVQPRLRLPRWNLVRSLICGILLLSAGAKLADSRDAERVSTEVIDHALFRLTLVQFELTVACLVAAPLWPQVQWSVSLVTFSAFLGASAQRVFQGSADCGCFGGLNFPPEYAATLDSAVIGLLFGTRRFVGGEQPSTNLPRAVMAFSIGSVCICLLATVFFNMDSSHRDASKLRVLAPDEWLGKPFPLLPTVDGWSGPSLQDGLFIFVRPNCSKCATVITALQQSGANPHADGTLDSLKIVLVWLPGRNRRSAEKEIIPGASSVQLRPDLFWVCQTPAIVQVRSGVVSHVSHDETALSTWITPEEQAHQ